MAEFPNHIGISCGNTECNIMTEYCRNNEICKSCNEDICTLQGYADFPLQCTFYCQRVGEEMKQLAVTTTTAAVENTCTVHFIYPVIISILTLMFLITLARCIYENIRIQKLKKSWKSSKVVMNGTKDEEESLKETEDTDSALSSSNTTDIEGSSLPNTTRDLNRTLRQIFSPQNDRGSRAKLVPAGMESHSITIQQE